jgi:hypothetical protein
MPGFVPGIQANTAFRKTRMAEASSAMTVGAA